MTKSQKLSLFLLRVSIGWLFLYAGLSKLMKGNWSAAGYLNSAKTFPDLYHWFASPGILPVINFLNEYGQILIGISLILGILVRYSSISAVLMMILYYFAVLQFPKIGTTAYIVDEHVIYALVLLLLFAMRTGKILGLEGKIIKME
ncbi:hypothetical protein A3H65_00980 [Candidatus Giovannonibacteria bacterium RIFCSPLOWO2_02_FULL_45_14]|uniref:DoxX subfamily n=1 Tax=Candidatus Giovannonibacteria bacterium RIFCSPLOWO2_12_FULL_44_15 TaxID=1798364 RepID=A0A1F5XZU3_9BACT|nr:MAG: hypothetical protein A3C75_01405 [Candidatus Giovannonibacteria bacterium RIFCSPHIGHO2_02_FULL_44_31]OGF76019.1 MAG: hypothetical protein A3E62_01815 [Candidatus Giovannonibacteria bacterium RIFCSPHIGHO2_12_FULL_44_29]OGF90915.1 MAG: hypothetical protein A3H65_00980 [Candidatus Giovannonibacteria bacterium RIFCSPLOWO2_02_FULL_45_14]OGF93435.1 MAG: hypothetical protein A3G54_04050 [Candidatus Giovannonibacteria bacterium RIFCSPLOWO2_12_FULL_44_15]